MAMPGDETEILAPGTDVNDPLKGSFTQNLFMRKQAWEIRPGFGQLTQNDCTMLMPDTGNSIKHGYSKVLGSQVMLTDFGHRQIVTVLSALVYTGNGSQVGSWANAVAVNIYDETANSRWEEILTRHTSENNPDSTQMDSWHGTYETDTENNYAAWVTTNDQPVCMVEYNDTLYFGSSGIGLWAYIPADFATGTGRFKAVNSIYDNDASAPYSESNLVCPVSPAPGQFAENYAYLDTASFPVPQDLCVLSNRLAIAAGKTVWFSDIGRATSIISTNFVSVSSDSPITALGEANGNLLVFTANETFLYQPSVGALISAGRMTKLSQDIGCLNPQAKVRAESALVWASKRGIHSSQGTLDLNSISEQIRPLFDEDVTNPLTSYFQASGVTTLAASQPRLVWDWADTSGVNLCYEALQNLLLVCVPSKNLILSYQKGSWSFWNAESLAVNSASAVAINSNLIPKRMQALQGDLYMMGGIEPYTPQDASTVTPDTSTSTSFFTLKWGRGGAIDRSVALPEDARDFAGYYSQNGNAPGFILDKPIYLPAGYVTPTGQTAPSDGWLLVPVRIVPPSTEAQPQKLVFHFSFDNAHWQPVCLTGGALVEAIYPSERIASMAGWNTRVTDESGNPDPTGRRIYCDFDGTAGSWTTAPYLNLAQSRSQTLFGILFQRKDSNVTTMSMGFVPFTASVSHNGSTLTAMDTTPWHNADVRNKHQDDDVAQPVDWCFRSAQINSKNQMEVRARGLRIRAVTHGKGSSPINPSFPMGLLNALVGSDWKDWVSQIVDYTGDPSNIATFENDAIRLRVKDSADNLFARSFVPGSASVGIQWSDTTVTTDGNFLIGDEEVDTLVISDSVKGETVSWTVYGFVRDRSERLVLSSVTALLRRGGGPRRIGR